MSHIFNILFYIALINSYYFRYLQNTNITMQPQNSISNGVFLMKKSLAISLIAFILFISYSAACLAEDMYVGDITKLNLRSGKGVKYGVIQTLDSGEKVTVLSTVNGWTKIGTMAGNEGWVASKYLTEQKPANLKIEDLNIQMENLQEQVEVAILKNNKLNEENISLTTRLNEISIKLGNAEKAFNALQTDSKEYLTLKNRYDKIAQEVTAKDLRIKSLEEKVNDQYIGIAVKWSLTGAGILLVGFFLGYRSKRKRSSLL